MTTIARVLAEAADALAAAGVDDARLEAEVLLAHVLDSDRAHLLASLQEPAPADSIPAFAAALARRRGREPLAYITGIREFYGLSIACTPDALIPRPESELLVDLALDEARRRTTQLRLADVGTGTGAIALAIAAHAPNVRVTAIDASRAALALAHRNIEQHGCGGRVDVVEGDLLANAGRFDVVVANLPYVSEREWASLAPEVRAYEPKTALVPGPRGTEAIERLLRESPPHLESGGVLAAEIGATQRDVLLAAAADAFPNASTCVKKDLAGLDRVLVVRTAE